MTTQTTSSSSISGLGPRLLPPIAPLAPVSIFDQPLARRSFSQVHYLSGPIRCEDAGGKPALPGDLLVVEMLELGPLPGDEWGFTGTFDRDNGGKGKARAAMLACGLCRAP
jgi:hypothetical protein